MNDHHKTKNLKKLLDLYDNTIIQDNNFIKSNSIERQLDTKEKINLKNRQLALKEREQFETCDQVERIANIDQHFTRVKKGVFRANGLVSRGRKDASLRRIN